VEQVCLELADALYAYLRNNHSLPCQPVAMKAGGARWKSPTASATTALTWKTPGKLFILNITFVYCFLLVKF
jgi:hypothetical protein